jgi:hypothetical protein
MPKVLVLNKDQSVFLSSLLGRRLAEYTMWGAIKNNGGQPVVKEGVPEEERAQCQALLDMVQHYQEDEPHVLVNVQTQEVLGIFQGKDEAKWYLELMFQDEAGDAGWVDKVLHHRHKVYDIQKANAITMESAEVVVGGELKSA